MSGPSVQQPLTSNQRRNAVHVPSDQSVQRETAASVLSRWTRHCNPVRSYRTSPLHTPNMLRQIVAGPTRSPGGSPRHGI